MRRWYLGDGGREGLRSANLLLRRRACRVRLIGRVVGGPDEEESGALSLFQAQHAYSPYISWGVEILTILGQA